MKYIAIVASLLTLWLGIIPSYLLAEPAVSSCFIDQYLTGKPSPATGPSPLTGNGQAFVANGLKYVVDPRLVVAIAGNETTFGTHTCVQFNAWNWSGGGACSNSPFTSWEAGLTTVTKFLGKSYLNKGYTTIPLIGAKYCTSGCQKWVPLVTKFYSTELGGNINNLGLSSIDNSPCLGPNPECQPATCSNFVPCNGIAGTKSCGTPVCASTAGGGGVCVEGSTQCAGLSDCTTSADCPKAGICAVNSCCGRPVCVPRSAFCSGQ
jgi:hypothetical protein